MNLTKAQKEIYYRITSDLEDYDKEPTLENIIDELKHQIDIELWHKEEYNGSYSGLSIRAAKNLLTLLIAEKAQKKISVGRGGKREGAGRPKGTTKPEIKKMFSFRLSPEEEKAIRELLKNMRST